MPSLNSRAVDISANYERRPEPEPVSGQGLPIISLPTPLPIYLRRHPAAVSAMPVIANTPDAVLRQYTGQTLPRQRVSIL